MFWEVVLMTKNMEKMRSEIIRAILVCFPKEYLNIVFAGETSIEVFVNEILIEFIKYAFDNSQEKHPLRYYVPYGVDENCSERMVYSRLLAYCQKYRDQEYEECKYMGADIEELKAKSMRTMEEKKEGYDITPMQYFELTNIHDIAALKSFVEGRLIDVKKVSNTSFKEMMEEYDRNVEIWSQKKNESDYNRVFYSLAFFTIDWKYGFEFAYLIAQKMEQLKVKEIDRNFFSILCARTTITSLLGCQVAIDSRMIKVRQQMIDVLIPDNLEWTDGIDLEMRCYAELLVIIAQLNNGIRLESGGTLREQFAKETTMEDWASFFKDYDVFDAWNKKELKATRIRNMRKVMSQMHK